MDADGEVVLQDGYWWLYCKLAFLFRPRSVSFFLSFFLYRYSDILVPGHEPVGRWWFIEVDGFGDEVALAEGADYDVFQGVCKDVWCYSGYFFQELTDSKQVAAAAEVGVFFVGIVDDGGEFGYFCRGVDVGDGVAVLGVLAAEIWYVLCVYHLGKITENENIQMWTVSVKVG